VLEPPVPLALRAALRGLVLANVGLLPEPLREQYGLRWSRAHRALLAASSHSTRRVVVPLLPRPLRRTEQLPLRVLAALAGMR
jgi:uncharacterized protein (DUF2236 family)